MDYSTLCLEVCQIARRAGEYIAQERKNFTSDSIEFKGKADMVSYVDKSAEKMIVTDLERLVPEAGFIAEEGSGAANPADAQARYRWVIDPLDGTTNFIHGLPPYAVSIALMDGEQTVVGVVYEITLDECFYAWQGGGAMLNGRPISASKTKTVKDSLIITGLAYDCEASIKSFIRCFEYFNRHSHGGRRLGSAATDLVYVAAGRADAFYQSGLSPWDVAAGALIAIEAGATVRDFDAGTNYVFGRSVLAANPNIWNEVHTIITEQ